MPQPRALSLGLHQGKNTAARVIPLCPTITHTTNQARGFLPEEQELVKELLNAKSESNRNNKEVGEEAGREDACHLKALAPWEGCTKNHILCSESKRPVGAAAGTWRRHSSFTLRCFVCVSHWETTVSWCVTPRSGTDLDCLCLVPYSLCL